MTTTSRKNNAPPKNLKLHDVARLVGGELVGDGTLVIRGVAGIKEAKKGDITFLANVKYLPFLMKTEATAVITASDVVFADKSLIRAANPSAAFTKIAEYFMPQSKMIKLGVHATAVVGQGVRLGKSVAIGVGVVIEDFAEIGEATVIEASVFIGSRAKVGSHSHIYPNAVIRENVQLGQRVIVHSGTVIGSDGFGYEIIDGQHIKIPQLGSVLIEDDVEIVANTCIDRGRFKNTVIGKGTKIDNLVQIAHNVVIGPNCVVVSQVGISGSTELGKNVVVAGQAGIVGHVLIGDEAVICARSGVSKSVPPKAIVLGQPAKPIQAQKKLFALIARLPEMFQDLSDLKKRYGGG